MDDMQMAAHVSDMDEYEDGQDPYDFPVPGGEPCPACGQPSDYCPGHGQIGDPEGFETLQQHDDEQHMDCHPMALCKIEEPEF